MKLLPVSQTAILSEINGVNHPPRRVPIITLGGCNLFEAFTPLRDFVDHQHFWRASIPSLASKPISAAREYFSDENVSRFFEREASKVVYTRITEFPDSAVFIEAAGDFSCSFLRIGETILPDIRNRVFGPEFEAIQFSATSEMHAAEVISTDSAYYWDLWKYYFDVIYRDVLQDRAKRGIPVVFLSRRFCLSELKDGVFVPLANSNFIARRNRVLDDIEEFVSRYAGVTLLKLDPQLQYTSASSPWGGPWEFHPEQGFYASLRQKLLDLLFPSKGRGETYLLGWIADAERQISELKTQGTGAERHASEMAAECQDLRQQILDLRSEDSSLRQQLDEARRTLEMERIGNETLRLKRDELAGQLAETEASVQECRTVIGMLQQAASDKEMSQSQAIEHLAEQVGSLEARNSTLTLAIDLLSSRYHGRLNIFERLRRPVALSFEIARLRKAGFDEHAYLQDNPDVLRSRMSAAKHYLRYGMREGRVARRRPA